MASVFLVGPKTEQEPKGSERRLGCSCPSKLCPVKVVRALVADSQSQPAASERIPYIFSKGEGSARKLASPRPCRSFVAG